jgi:ribosome-binding factor A
MNAFIEHAEHEQAKLNKIADALASAKALVDAEMRKRLQAAETPQQTFAIATDWRDLYRALDKLTEQIAVIL